MSAGFFESRLSGKSDPVPEGPVMIIRIAGLRDSQRLGFKPQRPVAPAAELFTLAFIAAGLAVGLYVFVFGMACAYVTRPGCSIRAPWNLGREDFLYLVAIPSGVVLLLVIGGIACRRMRR